jgi:4'-phosphopantetheinyl transferase
MEQIDSGQVHLWLAYLDEITDARLLAEYRLMLSEEEQRRQFRFHFERDRHRYLVTRAMQRTVLSRYVDIAPSAWRFTVNDYGRPSIAAEHAGARGIEFNLSHTDGLVVMAVTRERAIGVDVENVRTREADIEIADRYFAHEEVLALHLLPDEKQKQRFFEYWTLKESYIKARGMGLSISLERFAFSLEDPKQIRLSIDPGLRDHAGRWRVWQLRVDQDHLTALCAEGRAGERPYLASVRSWPSRRS